MPFIETIPPTQAQGDVLSMYARQQGHWGYVPNYAKVFCHRPEIMKLWADLLAGIRRHIDPERFEIVTLSAAYELKNSACAMAHGDALQDFYSEEEVRKIATDPANSNLSEPYKAMALFARKVAGDASAITREDADNLKNLGFSDGEVFDIVVTAAARAFFTKVLDGLGVEADKPFQEFSEPYRETMLVGRPISTDPTEHLPEQ